MIDRNEEERERRGGGLWAWLKSAARRVRASGRFGAVSRPVAQSVVGASAKAGASSGISAAAAGSLAAVVGLAGLAAVFSRSHGVPLEKGHGELSFMGQLERLSSKRYRELTKGEGLASAQSGGRMLVVKESRETPESKRAEELAKAKAAAVETQAAAERVLAAEERAEKGSFGGTDPLSALKNLGAGSGAGSDAGGKEEKKGSLSFYSGSGGTTSSALMASAGPAAFRDAASGLKAASGSGGKALSAASGVGRARQMRGQIAAGVRSGSSFRGGSGHGAGEQLLAANAASQRGALSQDGAFSAGLAGGAFDGNRAGVQALSSNPGGSGGGASPSGGEDTAATTGGGASTTGSSAGEGPGSDAGASAGGESTPPPSGNPFDDQNIYVPTSKTETKDVTPYSDYIKKVKRYATECKDKRNTGMAAAIIGVSLLIAVLVPVFPIGGAVLTPLEAVRWLTPNVSSAKGAQAATGWFNWARGIAIAAAITLLIGATQQFWSSHGDCDKAQLYADKVARDYQQVEQSRILSDVVRDAREGRVRQINPYQCGYRADMDMSGEEVQAFVQCMAADGDKPGIEKDDRLSIDHARRMCAAQGEGDEKGAWRLVLSDDEEMPYQCRRLADGTAPCKDPGAIIRETAGGYRCIIPVAPGAQGPEGRGTGDLGNQTGSGHGRNP
ncbi:MAG: hypothetical protein HY925_03255 [Elusimicrobia bacterium]|nr:hypothetical protein [Elusimicrobiota bacterium]